MLHWTLVIESVAVRPGHLHSVRNPVVRCHHGQSEPSGKCEVCADNVTLSLIHVMHCCIGLF